MNFEPIETRAPPPADDRIERSAETLRETPATARRAIDADPIKWLFGFLLMFVVGCIAAALLLWLVGRSH